MHETFSLVLTHIRMVWRFRWLALVLASTVCVVGWAGVVLMPDVYEVESKVFLDTRSMLRPLLRGLAIDNVGVEEDAARMMQRTLLVRPNLAVVARQTDLDLRAKTPEDFEALLDTLADTIRLSGTGRDNIFILRYENSDPELAARVVEAVLNLFVERSLGEGRKDAGKTRQFIDKQIAEYESKLTAAENRLKEFKQRNVGRMPSDGGSYFQRLQGINQQLAEARLLLDEATRRRDEYRRQLDGVETLFEPEIVASGPVAAPPHPLDGRIEALEKRLDELLLHYTEKHPDVSSTRAMLGNLQAERESTPVPVSAPSALPGTGPRDGPASVQQQLELALRQSEADVAGLTARVEEYERRAEEMRKLVDTIPRIEAELARLNRDYEVDKRNYDELVKRRESLSLAEDASQTAENVQFNILEPPRVPVNPVGPNRPLFSAVVLAAGLGIGVGLAWLIALIRPAFYSRDEVEVAFDLPVIGTVTRTWTRGEVLRRRAEVLSFVVGCFTLLLSFSALIAVEVSRAELLLRLRNVDILEQVVQKVGSLV